MQKQSFYILLPVILLTLISCGKKDKAPAGKPFVSIPSLVRNQVAQVDTSLFVIRKIVTKDTLPPDTSFVRREDFEKEAADWLNLPDLADPKIGKHYKQDSAVYEESIHRVILNYLPTDPDLLIRREQILITPALTEGDHISSMIVTTFRADRNGSEQKEMLWRVNKSFQVVTTTQLPGQPEQTTTIKISWNEENDQ